MFTIKDHVKNIPRIQIKKVKNIASLILSIDVLIKKGTCESYGIVSVISYLSISVYFY